jgi:glycosyltransferase involved in cell wall biosynthesis
MLVGIEVSSALQARRTGVGNYTMNLVAELRRLHGAGDEARFLYFANRGEWLCAGDAGPPHADTIYPRDRLPVRMLWLQAGLPRSIARTRPDLCHFPNHLAPLFGMGATPYLLTIHDMSVYHCPEHHALKTVVNHRAVMPAAARHARVIVTVSESARQDILRYLGVPPDRVRVVYEGVGSRFRPWPLACAPGDSSARPVSVGGDAPPRPISSTSRCWKARRRR